MNNVCLDTYTYRYVLPLLNWQNVFPISERTDVRVRVGIHSRSLLAVSSSFNNMHKLVLLKRANDVHMNVLPFQLIPLEIKKTTFL